MIKTDSIPVFRRDQQEKQGKWGNFLRKEHNQTGEIIDNITVEVAVLFKYPGNSNEKNETTNRGKQDSIFKQAP